MEFQELAYLLSYEYRNVFLEAEVYAKRCQIQGWKYNHKMLHLFEMLSSAQEKEQSIDSITNGKDVREFAKYYFKSYGVYDYLITACHFIAFMLFTILLCEWIHPAQSTSAEVYLRQIFMMLVVIVAGPLSRKFSKGKINWVVFLLAILIYVVLVGSVNYLSLPKEQFLMLSCILLIVYVILNGLVYRSRRTVTKAIQEKYNYYLRKKQYAYLISHFREGGIQTWQELVQRESNLLKSKKLKWVILAAVLAVCIIAVLWYIPLGSYGRWSSFSLLSLGIIMLYGIITSYEQKIKNMKSFEQEN